MKKDILINKNNILDESFVPKDLYQTDDNENNFHNYQDANLKPQVSASIMPYFLAMQNEALKNGFNIIVDSGYRSYLYQKRIWDKMVCEKGLEEAKRSVAVPGSSEHQSGLAIDIAFIRNGKYTDDVKGFDSEVLWLKENTHKYGFILRYPKNKEAITGYKFEPWHYRFVGIFLATILKQNDLTLEEYYLNKVEIDNMYNLKSKEEKNFITEFEFIAALLYFNMEITPIKVYQLMEDFLQKNPYIKIIKVAENSFEKMGVELKKINNEQLKEIAGEDIIIFIQENFHLGR